MKSILDAYMICPGCNWYGVLADCEPDIDDDGGLACPDCLTVCVDGEDVPTNGEIELPNIQKRFHDQA